METDTQDILVTLVQRSLGILSELHSLERRLQSLQVEQKIAGMEGRKSPHPDGPFPLSRESRPGMF